jgi:hypothetical protein
MSPNKSKERENLEIIKIGGEVYIRDIFGRDALKTVRDLDPTGKNVSLMQTTLMRKNEGKRFYF